MKRLTVNDKILLHLQQYNRYNSQFESPFELTQDGIAKSVGVSRGHVAVSMTKLKERGFVEEKMARVKGAARQRKVYFLSSEGINYVRTLVETIHKRTVRFRDMEGNEMDIKFSNLTAYLYPLINKTALPLEIIEHLTDDDIFDADTFIKKSKPGKTRADPVAVAWDMDGEKVEETVEMPIDDKPIYEPGTGFPPDTMTQTGEHSGLFDPQPAGYPMGFRRPFAHHYTFQYIPGSYYYHQGYPYYTPYQIRIPTHEQRKKKIISDMSLFFILGSMFAVLGVIAMLIDDYECVSVFFIGLILGMAFGVTGIVIGVRNIAFIGKTGRAIVIGMGSFYIVFMLIAIEALFFNLPSLIDTSIIGPMALIFATVIILVSFGKPIKLEHRVELAIEFGVFAVLYGLFSFILFPGDLGVNQFIYSPYWLLFGAISLIIGNELYSEKKKDEPDSIKHYFCAGIGAFLILLVASQMVYGVYNSGDLLLLNYLTGTLWGGVGLYLVGSRLAPAPQNKKMLDSVIASMPLLLGTLFILIGIYLSSLSRWIEGMVEFIIGLIVIRYGLSRDMLSGNPGNFVTKLGFPLFMIITICLTFYVTISNFLT